LNRLNQSNIYALLLHAPYDLKGPYGKCIIKTLNEFKSNKIIQKLGISIYSPSELNDLLPLIDLDLVQVPYNIFDRRIEKSGWLKVLNDRSIEVHGRSAFLQGLLTMDFNDIPNFFARYKKIFKAWSDWTTSNNLSLIEASLLFSISSNQIQKTVIGIDNIEQLTEIIEYSKNTKSYDFPDLSIDDETLLNPSNWKIA
jgi:aryl-alcohol dehydrogenase-like predicted oxidoreductase